MKHQATGPLAGGFLILHPEGEAIDESGWEKGGVGDKGGGGRNGERKGRVDVSIGGRMA